MNGDTVDSWIRSLSTYVCTCPKVIDDMKLQITNIQLEGIVQMGRDTQLENFSLVIDKGDRLEPQKTNITTWDGFF